MSAKNTALLRRSARLSSQPTTSSSADKKPVPEMETMVSDAGLKIKQGEMGVNDAEELISSLEAKISKAEEVKNFSFSAYKVYIFIFIFILLYFIKNVQFLSTI